MQLKAELIHDECRRRSERRRTAARGTFGQGFDRVVVDIVDLSLEGARLATDIALEPGTRIWLKLPMLSSRAATVVWSSGFEVGCEFCDTLCPMTFEVLTRPRACGATLSPARTAPPNTGRDDTGTATANRPSRIARAQTSIVIRAGGRGLPDRSS